LYCRKTDFYFFKETIGGNQGIKEKLPQKNKKWLGIFFVVAE
jgi:hypothetical protein